MTQSSSVSCNTNGFYNPPSSRNELTFGRRSTCLISYSTPLQICLHLELFRKSEPHHLRRRHPCLKYQCLAPLPKHIQLSTDEASSLPTPRELSWASGYILLKHKTFTIISLARTGQSRACAQHQSLPECSTTSLCQSVCQTGQRRKRRLKLLDSLVSGACLWKENHTFPHPGQAEPNNNQHLFLTHSFPVLPAYLLN